jgi:hypothetical protein
VEKKRHQKHKRKEHGPLTFGNDGFLKKRKTAFLAGETPHAGICRGSIMVSLLSLFVPFRFSVRVLGLLCLGYRLAGQEMLWWLDW